MDRFYFKEFCKTLRTFLQNNNAIQLLVWKDNIFKGFLLWLPWQHNYLKEFERRPPKEHSCEIWKKSSQ